MGFGNVCFGSSVPSIRDTRSLTCSSPSARTMRSCALWMPSWHPQPSSLSLTQPHSASLSLTHNPHPHSSSLTPTHPHSSSPIHTHTHPPSPILIRPHLPPLNFTHPHSPALALPGSLAGPGIGAPAEPWLLGTGPPRAECHPSGTPGAPLAPLAPRDAHALLALKQEPRGALSEAPHALLIP